MAKTTKSVTLDHALPRADHAVRDLTGLSRAGVRGLFDHGCVTVDGAEIEAGAPLPAGTTVLVTYDPARRYKELPRVTTTLAIVFEDPHLIVVDKPAGILTVPTAKGETDTLLDEVVRHVNRGGRMHKQVTVVQRLDRDTSGLLVFAKNKAVGAKLQAQLTARKPEREYVAIVAGRVEAERGSFRSYLRTNEALSEESSDDPTQGKEAVTHYEVAERRRDVTAVRVHLETGRRNQIRVHFALAGHPVLGDRHYAPEKATHPLWRESRLALHARRLGFVHPVTHKSLRFESKPPRCFGELLERAPR